MITFFSILPTLNNIKKKLSIYRNNNESWAEQDAWLLLQTLTGKNKKQLLTDSKFKLSSEQLKKLSLWLRQITIENKPIQYIVGSVPFCNVEILVEPPILIPRPETEELCSWLIKQLQKVASYKINILDLCSGSGCIGLAIAKDCANFQVTCTDINLKAINLIKKNIEHNNINNATVIKSDLYEKIPQTTKFDLIISNPPYISPQEWEGLDKNIRLWEDKRALVSDKEGTAIIEQIIKQSPTYLTKNTILINNNIPLLLLEISEKQASKVMEIFKTENIFNVRIFKDMALKDRWVAAYF